LTRVEDYRRQAGLDLLPRLLVKAGGKLDVAVVRSLMEMRAAIGPDSAALCAQRARPDTVTELGATAGEITTETDLAVLARLDATFWDLVVDGSDNIAYRLALNSLRRSYQPVEAAVSEILATELRDAAGHHAVADAISAGKAEQARVAAVRLLAQGTAAMTEFLT
jgi:DNA-binding FadR family transcriptional regulator